jgi:hypothetical protein
MGSVTGNIQNTVDGAGLSGNTPALTGLHAIANGTNSWLSASVTGNIDFNLNGLYNLNGFSFWNYNNSFISGGIKGVSILTSTDGFAYTSLTGAPTQFFQGVNASESPEIFTFSSPTTASYVRFTVTSNYGFPVTGFSEVQFDSAVATPVPFDFDPSLGVVSLGVVFGINKWRKNRSNSVKK